MVCYVVQSNQIESAGGNSGSRPYCVATPVGFLFGDHPMKTKNCSKCHKIKPIADFNRRSDYPARYRSECIVCQYTRQNIGARGRKIPVIQSQANSRARYAKKMGRLVAPERCEKCAKPAKLEMHHDDYTKPFDVTWLCIKCHHKHHLAGGRCLSLTIE